MLVTSGLGGRFPEGVSGGGGLSLRQAGTQFQRAWRYIPFGHSGTSNRGFAAFTPSAAVVGADRNGANWMTPEEVHRVANESLHADDAAGKRWALRMRQREGRWLLDLGDAGLLFSYLRAVTALVSTQTNKISARPHVRACSRRVASGELIVAGALGYLALVSIAAVVKNHAPLNALLIVSGQIRFAFPSYRNFRFWPCRTAKCGRDL